MIKKKEGNKLCGNGDRAENCQIMIKNHRAENWQIMIKNHKHHNKLLKKYYKTQKTIVIRFVLVP